MLGIYQLVVKEEAVMGADLAIVGYSYCSYSTSSVCLPGSSSG